MKRIIAALSLTILVTINFIFRVQAQSSDSIWLTASTTTYKTGETVSVALNASSATPIQGFTFQIRYDPTCLSPMNASSPIPAMNGLPLPQLSGLVDGSYASKTPQTVSGILAEIRFTALKGCQTGLNLESAALVTRSPEGFAIPLAGVSIDEQNVSLYIDKEMGVANSSQPESGSTLHLEPPKANQEIPVSIMIIRIISVFLVGLLMFGVYKLFRSRKPYKEAKTRPSAGTRKAALHVKHGPHAGKRFALNKLPVLIGRDPQNDICINDPHIISYHAQIYSERNGYFLRDLGGGTLINGQSVRNNVVFLNPGDEVQLGRSVLFVFR